MAWSSILSPLLLLLLLLLLPPSPPPLLLLGTPVGLGGGGARGREDPTSRKGEGGKPGAGRSLSSRVRREAAPAPQSEQLGEGRSAVPGSARAGHTRG